MPSVHEGVCSGEKCMQIVMHGDLEGEGRRRRVFLSVPSMRADATNASYAFEYYHAQVVHANCLDKQNCFAKM